MRWILTCVLLLAVLGVGGGVLWTWENESISICAQCFSRSTTVQGRLGDRDNDELKNSMPLTRLVKTVEASPFFLEQMGSACSHDFKLDASFRSNLVRVRPGSLMGLAYMNVRWSRLSEAYHRDPGFRRFILEKERRGDLDRSDFVAAAQLEDYWRPYPRGRSRELYELAEWLLGEYFETHPPR